MKKQTIIAIVIAVIVVLAIIVGVVVWNNQKSNEGTTIETASQMKEMFKSIYNKLGDELPNLETQKIDVSDASMVKAYTGLQSNENVETIVVSEPSMSAQAYSAVAVKVKAGANIENMKQEMLDNIDMAKWICVSASNLYITNSGNTIFMVMSDEDWAKLVYDSFKEQVENKIGKELEKSEDTDYELPPEITGNSVSPVSPILDGTDSVVPPVVDDENNEVTTEASGNLK